MTPMVFTFLAIVALVLVSPIASPLIIWHLNRKRDEAVAADIVRRHFFLSALVTLILLLGFSGISFHAKIGNIVAVILACSSYLLLISLSFSVRPRLVGLSIGIVSSIVAPVIFLLAVSYSLDDIQYAHNFSPDLYCEVSYSGWDLSGSGTKIRLFKTHFGVDRQVNSASFEDGQDTLPFTTHEGACIYLLGQYHRPQKTYATY